MPSRAVYMYLDHLSRPFAASSCSVQFPACCMCWLASCCIHALCPAALLDTGAMAETSSRGSDAERMRTCLTQFFDSDRPVGAFEPNDLELLWSRRYRTLKVLDAASRDTLQGTGLPAPLVDLILHQQAQRTGVRGGGCIYFHVCAANAHTFLPCCGSHAPGHTNP